MKTQINKYADTMLSIDGIVFTLIMDDAMLIDNIGIKSLHSHKYFELFFVEKGDIQIELGTKIITIFENEVVIIPPHIIHRSLSGHKYIRVFCIEFLMVPSDSQNRSRTFMNILRTDTPIVLNTNTELKAVFSRFEHYAQRESKYKLALMGACFYEMLCLIKELFADQADTDKVLSDLNSEYRGYIIDDYINSHFLQEISLSELARLVYLSERQVNNIIKKTYGQSFHKRVLSLRMQNATKLLCETDMMIKDIAVSVGYASVHGFYSAFEKLYDVTPDEYRRKHS